MYPNLTDSVCFSSKHVLPLTAWETVVCVKGLDYAETYKHNVNGFLLLTERKGE